MQDYYRVNTNAVQEKVACCGPGVDRQPSTVAIAMSGAQAALGRLDDNISTLMGRLEPILKSPNPQAASAGERPSADCKVAEEIQILQNRLHSLADTVYELSRRVDL